MNTNNLQFVAIFSFFFLFNVDRLIDKEIEENKITEKSGKNQLKLKKKLIEIENPIPMPQ